MTTKPKRKAVKVLNPRYAGATPEMVGKALLKHPPTGRKRQPKAGQTTVRSRI